jgi:hypothetical protein
MFDISHINQINQLHDEAMELSDLAFAAKRRGDNQSFIQYSRQAYEKEAQAADYLRDTNAEPTRSVLYRSAATLALDCKETREAERLIAIALIGNPPEAIANELRDLLEQVNFERHLALRGVELLDNELQFSLSGKAVGFGLALADVVIRRVSQLEKLIQRTVERVHKQQYRENSSPALNIKNDYSLYMGAFRPGSFSMTFKLGKIDQPKLEGFDDANLIIAEVVENIALVNNELLDILKNKIQDPAYYRNFIGLAKQLAPDGVNISSVNLTAIQNGSRISATLTKEQNQIPLVPKQEEEDKDRKLEVSSEIVTISGTLQFADSTKAKNQIKLVDNEAKIWTIYVPEGLMRDVVRPYYEDKVMVTGNRIKEKRKSIFLLDISQIG